MLRLLAVSIVVVCLSAVQNPLVAHDLDEEKSIGNSAPPGVGGFGPWAYANIAFCARLPLNEIGGGPANVIGSDCWGWTDSQTGREYAIFCLTNGTSFIDITDAENPVFLGKLPTQTGNKAWRDVKIYSNHAYIVADNNGEHGLQIFDLTQLRNAHQGAPHTFSNTAHFAGFNESHNIAINQDSGFAYIVGSEQASGGLYVLDLSNPIAPVHVGNFSDDGYTHDCQVVDYLGPDTDYAGREIAFNCNADTLTIVDVTDKSDMTQISRTGYAGRGYTHQGWLSEDHRYFYMNDELDERNAGGQLNTMTRVWNVEDLDNPYVLNVHSGTQVTIDHNLYVKDGLIYQANYTSGLRVLEVVDGQYGRLNEIAYFDTYNTDNELTFNGAWSVFPYFDSGAIIVSDRQNGLFIVKLLESLAPQSLKLADGVKVDGQLSDLSSSDNQYLELDPSPTKNLLKQKVQMVLQTTSPSDSPKAFQFQFESSMLGGPAGDVIQSIELLNYNTLAFELLDQRPVANEDSLREYELYGDLSRFVQIGTREMTAKVTWKSESFSGPQFTWSIDVDQAIWKMAD